MIGLLEEQRSFARARVSQILMDGCTTGTCCHRCGWSSQYAFAYSKLLHDRNLKPTDITCISKAIEQIEMMPDPTPEEGSVDCPFAYKHTVPNYRVDHRREFDCLRAHTGLCLTCIKSGNTRSDYCSVIHEV